MGLVLFLFFIVMPIVELYVAWQVGSAIGALNAIGLLIAISLIGAWVVKLAGINVLRRVQRQVRAGQTPTRELVDGALVLAAGVLLVAPGFVTDALGILLLIPPTRAVVRGVVMRRLSQRTKLIRATYTGPIDVTSHETRRGELGH